MIHSQLKPGFSTKKIRLRITLVGVSYLLFFALLAARAFELHLTDNSKLSSLAQNQYKRRVVTAPKRGNILDTHGDTLAIDIQVDSAYATPHLLTDPSQFAGQLAQALKIPEAQILQRVSDPKKKFVWIKRRLAPEESKLIKGMKLPALATLPEYKRFYPNGLLAANLLGAVGYDAVALSGLELAYDSTLKSVDPPMLVEQDAKGRSYAPYGLVGHEEPNEIVLTLDKTIQYLAERELQAAMAKHRAKGGVALVMKVKTGEILGMATQPTFDPNDYSKYDFHQWRNRAVTDVFEPGSIFKAITAAAALETGAFNLTSTLHCENGKLKVDKYTIHDHHGYGALKLEEIIKYSSNICSYKLAQKVGKKRFYEFLKAFGFGEPTGVEAPGEVGGILASYRDIGALQLGTIAFGQGISTTPMQIAAAYAAIANGGNLMKPYLLKEIRDPKGGILKKFEPQLVRRVVSETTARKVTRLLETVVEKGGTGTAAALDTQRVGGKTGTAQKVLPGQKGYAKSQYVASFVGFAPARDPELIVLVSIDEPKGDYYGGLVSAPIFKEIMEQSLAYLKVAPDRVYMAEIGERVPSKRPKDVRALATHNPKPLKPAAKTPAAGPMPSLDTLPNLDSTLSGLQVPDFTGLSVREVLRKSEGNHFKVQIKGSGICNKQEPMPGIALEAGTPIVLECSPPI